MQKRPSSFFENIPKSSLNLALRFMSIITFLVLIIEKFSLNSSEMTKRILLYFNLIVFSFAIILGLFYECLVLLKYKKINILKTDFTNKENSISIYMLFLLLTMQINAFAWITNHFFINNQKIILNILSMIVIFIFALQSVFSFKYFLMFSIKQKSNNKQNGFSELIVIFSSLSLCSTYSINLGDFISLWFFQIIWIISFVLTIYLYLSKVYKFIFLNYKNKKNIVPIAVFTRPINLLFLGFVISFNPNRLFFIDNINSNLFIIENLSLKLTLLNNFILYSTLIWILVSLSFFTYACCFGLKWKYLLKNKQDKKYIWLTLPGSITSAFILRFNDWMYINNFIYFLITGLMFITYVLTFIDTIRLNITNMRIIKNAII
ncbi:hypothetical protein [Mycoplasma zalophi]|uniref:Uncharacterized protein n=1 Tax=Mycoplasma zalophi TaxID=191287 RepID=A0ABS6DQ50_9MOLU|nr:hypothetical protein [Mycoplasma zalophi]MBU4690947.1 hypothetical protein [Mycoplasma zalophi]MBU4692273.1 hypothetical protein [Mycoplasma zalophi]